MSQYKTVQSSTGVIPVCTRAVAATSVSEGNRIILKTSSVKILFNFMLLHDRRTKTLPPRPAPAKPSPGRPPPPSLQSAGRSVSVPTSQTQKPQRKGAALPPRPNPGHRLYNKYTVRDTPETLRGLLCFSSHLRFVDVCFS